MSPRQWGVGGRHQEVHQKAPGGDKERVAFVHSFSAVRHSLSLFPPLAEVKLLVVDVFSYLSYLEGSLFCKQKSLPQTPTASE